MTDSNFPQRFQGNHLGNAEQISVPQNAVAQQESNRAVAEVQASLVMAKRFPRDTNAAYTAIIEACKRKRVAETALYAYKRGGQMVTGPSIRMAEILAQNYGNLAFGIVEVERLNGESQMMAYCHDLQTNVRQTRVFAVPHARTSNAKGRVELTDDRDVYETTANQGARRLRACILGIIPPDFIDGAIAECEATLRDADKGVPMADRIRAMLVAFQDLGVSQEMVEKKLQHKSEAINEPELAQLRKIYTAIKDGVASREEHFVVASVVDPAKVTNLHERLPEAPKTEPVQEAAKESAPVKKAAKSEPKTYGDFVVSFGVHTGKKLGTFTPAELSNLYAQLQAQDKVATSPAIKELLNAIESIKKA
jgi:hypothetical protein